MNFIKTFLAAILAFVVGSFLVFFLWIFILLGIAGSMEKTVAVHAESILKIDFSDVLTDAPSSDPFAGIDFATLRSTRQLPLMKALRALEAAKDDSRIKGIYLRMNGNGGVMGAALLWWIGRGMGTRAILLATFVTLAVIAGVMLVENSGGR